MLSTQKHSSCCKNSHHVTGITPFSEPLSMASPPPYPLFKPDAILLAENCAGYYALLNMSLEGDTDSLALATTHMLLYSLCTYLLELMHDLGLARHTTLGPQAG